MSLAFQKQAHRLFDATWGHTDEPWNLDRQWLIYMRGHKTGRMFITHASEQAFDLCPAPEIDPILLQEDPVAALLSLVEQNNVDRVNALERDPAGIMLINAMADATVKGELIDMYEPKHGVVTVELKVNGHIVPYAEFINRAWRDLERRRDADVAGKAMELLKDQSINPLLDIIDNVQRDIRNKLEVLTGHNYGN